MKAESASPRGATRFVGVRRGFVRDLCTSLHKLRHLMAGQTGLGALLLIVMLFGAVAEGFGLSLILPLISGLIGQEIEAPGQIAEYIGYLLVLFPEEARVEALLGLFALAFLIKGTLLVTGTGLQTYFAMRLRERWAACIFEHYLGAKPNFFYRERQGRLVQNIANETQVAAKGVLFLFDMTNKLILTVVLFVVLLLANWMATVAIMIFGGVVVFLIRRSTYTASIRLGRRRLKYSQDIAVITAESISNVRQIKLFDAYVPIQDRMKDRLRRYTKTQTLFEILSQIPVQLTEFIVIALFAVVLLIAKNVIHVDLAQSFAFLGFFLIVSHRMLAYVGKLISRRMQFLANMPSLVLVYDLMHDAPSREVLHRGIEFSGLQGDIEFRNVSFVYDDGTPVLTNLNLTIRRGETTAIIGRSGIGKSTLAAMLVGLCVPEAGQILFGDRDLRDFSLASLRRHIGYVTQEPELFHATVRDNILLGRPDATEQDCVEAARFAHADEFIQALPEGYDTMVGERGATLSGGQRQRLALARVILGKPDLYIFDEATSSLDQESDALIQDSIVQLAGSATVLIIAHRLSTIGRANMIYRLEDGGRAEPVTFDKLCT